MFINFFTELRVNRIPVTLKEFLSFLEALNHGFGEFNLNEFYYVARTSLVKDERHIDRFDKVFSYTFQGLEKIDLQDLFESAEIPEGWDEKDPANASPLVTWLSSKECAVTGRMFEISGGKINLCDGWRHGQSEEVKGRMFKVNEIGSVVDKLTKNSPPPETVYGAR